MFEKDNSNPFTHKCKNCVSNIWEKIQKKANDLNSKCYTNTYVRIEKFKDDNF